MKTFRNLEKELSQLKMESPVVEISPDKRINFTGAAQRHYRSQKKNQVQAKTRRSNGKKINSLSWSANHKETGTGVFGQHTATFNVNGGHSRRSLTNIDVTHLGIMDMLNEKPYVSRSNNNSVKKENRAFAFHGSRHLVTDSNQGKSSEKAVSSPCFSPAKPVKQHFDWTRNLTFGQNENINPQKKKQLDETLPPMTSTLSNHFTTKRPSDINDQLPQDVSFEAASASGALVGTHIQESATNLTEISD